MSIRSFLARTPRIPVVLRLKYYRWWNPVRCRWAGVELGRHSNIINSIYLFRDPEARIRIGEWFTLTSGDGFNPLSRNIKATLCARGKGVIEIGNWVGISSAAIWATNRITIGDRVLIGADCILMDNDQHHLNAEARRDPERARAYASAPIVIEDEVFIGMRSMILKGVTIGARSVVGAGSVVTRDVPPDTIVAGNPARVIGHLDPPSAPPSDHYSL